MTINRQRVMFSTAQSAGSKMSDDIRPHAHFVEDNDSRFGDNSQLHCTDACRSMERDQYQPQADVYDRSTHPFCSNVHAPVTKARLCR